MRMKQIILVLTVVLLLAGAVYVFVIRQGRAADPLDYLPGDTLALIDLHQPAALYGKYRQSRLGQRMNSIRWDDLLRQFGASEVDAGIVQEKVDHLQAFFDGPVFRELFGGRAVLALLPAAHSSAGGNVSLLPSESLVLIASPLHQPDVAELLVPLLAGDSQSATESYQDREIRTFILADNMNLAVVASDGLLLASFSIDTVKRCLDLALRQAAAGSDRLNGNPDYLSLRQRSGGRGEQFAYGNVQAVTRFLFSVSGLGPGMTESSILPWATNFGHGAFFCDNKTERLNCTAILQKTPDGAGAVKPSAVDNTLAVAPADLLLHFWTNLPDISRVAAGLRHNPQFRHAIGSADEWLVQKAGLTFPDFLSLFDSPISLTVTGVRGNGFVPLPRLYGRLAVKDGERLRQALTALLAGKNQTSKDVAGFQVHTLMLAGGLLQPSWAIREGQVLFADSLEQFEQSLLQPEAPLTESPRFRQVDVGLAAPNNMTTYVNYPRFLDGLQQFAAWTATILAMMDQERGGLARALVDLVVTPVLDGMKMFAAGSLRLLDVPSELVMESALSFTEEAGEEE